MKSIRVLLSEPELATLERIRALGFSSHAELLRCATLAWVEAAARLPDEASRPSSVPDDVAPGTPCPP